MSRAQHIGRTPLPASITSVTRAVAMTLMQTFATAVAATMLATSAFAQSAKEIRGPTPYAASAIAPTLEQAEIARARHKPTESLDAYDVYLRGMASVYRGTKEGVSEALRLFGKAIESDSSFAAAYGMAAWCYVWRRMHGWMSERDKEIAEAHRLALKAV